MSTAVRPKRSFAVPLASLLVFAAALAFYTGFADYGFNREDEGTLLIQFWRWSLGEIPYRDFHMGYTPGVHFLHKTLMQWFGPGLMPGRYLLCAVNSMSAALLYALTARVTGSWKWGLLSPLLYLAAVPVHTGEFAAFNIPYPVWYNLLLFALTAAMMPRLAERPGIAWLVACGLLAGAGFTFKPNVGLFQLAACALVCLLGYGRPRSLFEHLVWWGWWLGTMAGILVVFSSAQTTRELVTFLAPVAAAGVAVARDAYRTPSRNAGPALLTRAIVIGIGFLVVCVPWLAWSYSILGAEWFTRRALFLGAGFESVYYLSGPPIQIGGTVVFASAAAWFLPRLIERRGWPSWPLPLAGAIAASAAFVHLVQTRPMPEGVYAAVMKEVEPTVFTAAAFVEGAALMVWLTRRRPPAGTEAAAGPDLLGPSVICGVMLYLQIFPRTDFMHWVTAAPLLFPCTAWLLQALAVRWATRGGAFVRRAVATAIVLPVVATCLFRIGHFLDARWDWVDGHLARTPETVLHVAHAPISINVGRAEAFRNLEATVDYITANSAPTDPVFTFPALDYVSYLSLRRPGNRHGYYFPGWPGHDTEVEVLTSLEKHPPRLAVTLYEPQLYFASAAAYYFLFADFFEDNYRRVAREGPYAILAENHPIGSPPPDDHAGPGPSVPVAPTAVADALGAERMAAIDAALASPDAAVRIATAQQMAEWRIQGDFEPLRRALADPDAAVRSAAVKAVPQTRSPAVRDVLLRGAIEQSFNTADSVLAIRAAGIACDANCIPPILRLVESFDWDVATAARGAMSEMPTARWRRDFWWKWEGDGAAPFPPETVAKLLPTLKEPDSDPGIRTVAFAFADRLGLGPCPRILKQWASMRIRFVGPDFTVPTALYQLSRANCPGPWLDLALRWLPLESTLTARTVLHEAARHPGAADAALARHANARFGTASAIGQWICSMVGGEQCLAAARATLGESRNEEERIAAAWSWAQLSRNDTDLDDLRSQISVDPSPQVRETAHYGILRLEHRRAGSDAAIPVAKPVAADDVSPSPAPANTASEAPPVPEPVRAPRAAAVNPKVAPPRHGTASRRP